MMATEIRIPKLTGSRNYELWKLQTQAWTFVTEMSKEKQALAVALNLPEDDKWKIKEKVFGELELDVLNSENGMSVLFEFLDEYLLEDELMNRWNTFEDFEKFERKPGQNIREYVADFDLKFRKLEKIHIKLPPEILAFKLLRNANLSKQERMFVLTCVSSGQFFTLSHIETYVIDNVLSVKSTITLHSTAHSNHTSYKNLLHAPMFTLTVKMSLQMFYSIIMAHMPSAYGVGKNIIFNKVQFSSVQTGVDFADKENMYKETKHSLLKLMGDLTVGKARTGLDIKLEPAWRKSASSSNRTVQEGGQHCKIGWMQ